jgi:hypothetical protein
MELVDVELAGTAGGGEPGLDLEVRAAARRQRPRGGDPATGEEERTHVTGLDRRHEQAAFERAQPREPFEIAAHRLERLDPVAEPSGVLEPARVRK